MKDRRKARLTAGALTAMELAAIDVAIVSKQAAGFTLGSFNEDDDEARAERAAAEGEARAEAAMARWEERHGGIVGDLTDVIVLEAITDLSTQLASRASLATLVALRGEVLAGPG